MPSAFKALVSIKKSHGAHLAEFKKKQAVGRASLEEAAARTTARAEARIKAAEEKRNAPEEPKGKKFYRNSAGEKVYLK